MPFCIFREMGVTFVLLQTFLLAGAAPQFKHLVNIVVTFEGIGQVEPHILQYICASRCCRGLHLQLLCAFHLEPLRLLRTNAALNKLRLITSASWPCMASCQASFDAMSGPHVKLFEQVQVLHLAAAQADVAEGEAQVLLHMAPQLLERVKLGHDPVWV